jgi:nucleolar complex protein 2
MMNEIALHNTNVFVNSLPFALEILQAPEVLKKASTHGTLKPTSLTYTLKVANKLLGTKVYQDALITNTLDVIHDYMSVYSYSIAFPELAIPCVVTLKKFAKRCRNGIWRKKTLALIETVRRNFPRFLRAHALLDICDFHSLLLKLRP